MEKRSVAAAAVAVVVTVVIGLAATASAATLFSDDFQDGNATGWNMSGGTWSVVADGTQVLRQAGTSSDARARRIGRLDRLHGHGTAQANGGQRDQPVRRPAGPRPVQHRLLLSRPAQQPHRGAKEARVR